MGTDLYGPRPSWYTWTGMGLPRVSVVATLCAGVIACTPTAPVDRIPQAVASADRLAGNAPLTVAFTGKALGGDPPLKYAWDFGDGQSAQVQSPTHTYPVKGSYHAVLTVTDVDGDADQDDLTVQVASSALTARVGADPLSGKAPLQVQFTSGVTGGAQPYTSDWDFGDGNKSTDANPVHVFNTGGQYAVTYKVTDANGKSATDQVQISVSDASKPAATATATPTSGAAPLTVAFQGSATGGTAPYTWEWDFGDASPKSKAANPSHTYQSAGTYTAALTVTDANGATDSRSVQITAAANSVPVASASATPTKGVAPLQVAFTGQATGGDKPLTWSWDFGDGGTSSQPTPTHTYQTAGVYTATLTVTDGNGDSSSAQVSVEVGDNQIPKVTASAKPVSGTAPLTVSFSGTASGGNPPLTFSWDLGDGSTSTNQNPSHTYQAAGTYNATVTVTDANGDTDTSSVSINVASNSQPVVTASASPTSGQAPLAVSFYASAQGGNPPLTWSWSFGDGSKAATTANTTHTYQAAGTYTAQVVATDVDGDASSATVTIQVSSNSIPHARAFADVTQGIAPLKVSFTSQVTGGDAPLTYAWDFGDGAGTTGTSASHTYQKAGSYTVLLTVTDANGDTSTDTLTINVASNSVPTVSASASPGSGAPPLAVAFTATTSGGNAPSDLRLGLRRREHRHRPEPEPHLPDRRRVLGDGGGHRRQRRLGERLDPGPGPAAAPRSHRLEPRHLRPGRPGGLPLHGHQPRQRRQPGVQHGHLRRPEHRPGHPARPGPSTSPSSRWPPGPAATRAPSSPSRRAPARAGSRPTAPTRWPRATRPTTSPGR